MLSAYEPGNYILYSPLQKENGPRLFQPSFGFRYRGVNTYIHVYILPGDQTNFTLTPSAGIYANDNNWSTFLRNLTSISYFNTSWNTGKEWQVRCQ